MGMPDLLHQAQSLGGGAVGRGEVQAVASGGWQKQLGAEGLGFWNLVPQCLWPSSAREAARHIPWSWAWLRKSAAHGLLVGTQRNKHCGHRDGTGALPCRRGCGQQAHSGDGGRWRAISLALVVRDASLGKVSLSWACQLVMK